MILSRHLLILLVMTLLFGCEESTQIGSVAEDSAVSKAVMVDSIIEKAELLKLKFTAYESLPDTGFVVMNQFGMNFSYDMKYATKDNFLKKAVYSCDLCLVRKEVAVALQKINDTLSGRGLRIKFYDCYRPLSVQKQMWMIYPNASYVANPNKGGSVHNRGAAVDITLVDREGKELDMGTSFDHFGAEAHHTYTHLPDTVLTNRKLLKETMERFGFKSLSSEWWHYTFLSKNKYRASDFIAQCDSISK